MRTVIVIINTFQNDVYYENLKKFEEMKKRVKVRSLALDRAQSDPTTYGGSYKKSRLILPWEMFEKKI